MTNEPPSIIRITKQQVERAKKAAKTAREQDPHFRAFIEEQEKRRKDAAVNVGKNDTDATARVYPPGLPEYLNLTDERMNPRLPGFSLTPREPGFNVRDGYMGFMNVFGPTFLFRFPSEEVRACFDEQHANDEFWFVSETAADPEINYKIENESKRFKVPHILLYYDLTSVNPRARRVILDFHFDVPGAPDRVWSRLLIYTCAEQVSDLKLFAGRNRFRIEVEDIRPMQFAFVHANLPDSDRGGSWFFRGISGYVTT